LDVGQRGAVIIGHDLVHDPFGGGGLGVGVLGVAHVDRDAVQASLDRAQRSALSRTLITPSLPRTALTGCSTPCSRRLAMNCASRRSRGKACAGALFITVTE